MNAAWAQACIEFRNTHLIEFSRLFSLGLRPSQIGIFIKEPPGAEPFSDTGFVGGPPGAAGNGIFHFTDTNTNGTHDMGEPSETFDDCNGNNGYDFAVNLVDGSLDEYADASKPTKEERSLIETLGDKKAET